MTIFSAAQTLHHFLLFRGFVVPFFHEFWVFKNGIAFCWVGSHIFRLLHAYRPVGLLEWKGVHSSIGMGALHQSHKSTKLPCVTDIHPLLLVSAALKVVSACQKIRNPVVCQEAPATAHWSVHPLHNLICTTPRCLPIGSWQEPPSDEGTPGTGFRLDLAHASEGGRGGTSVSGNIGKGLLILIYHCQRIVANRQERFLFLLNLFLFFRGKQAMMPPRKHAYAPLYWAKVFWVTYPHTSVNYTSILKTIYI